MTKKDPVVDHRKLFYLEGGEQRVNMEEFFKAPAFKRLIENYSKIKPRPHSMPKSDLENLWEEVVRLRKDIDKLKRCGHES